MQMNNPNQPILLMTAAVNPRGCGMFSVETRECQYLHSLAFVCRKLRKHPELFSSVLFCDNSGWNLSRLKNSIPESLRERIHFISFSPEEFDPSRLTEYNQKSYNEMLMMDKVMEETSSKFNDDNPLFLKVTGRFPILNLVRMAKGLSQANHSVQFCIFPQIAHFKSALFHPVTWADARCFAFRKSVWTSVFQGAYKNNKAGLVYEEDQLDSAFKNHAGEEGWDLFEYPPLTMGKQGHKVFYHGLLIPKWIEPVFLLYFWVLDYLVNLFSPPVKTARL